MNLSQLRVALMRSPYIYYIIFGLTLSIAGVFIALGSNDTAVLALLAGLMLAVLLACILTLPAYLSERDARPGRLQGETQAKARNDVRTALLQGFAGVLLLVGIFATFTQLRNSQQQLEVSREGEKTTRFSSAVDKLASASLDQRLGGVFILKDLAAQDASRRGEITQMLTAFVAVHAPHRKVDLAQPQVADPSILREPIPDALDRPLLVAPLIATRPDLQASLDYLVDEVQAADSLSTFDLSGIELQGADLGENSRLGKARLDGSDLRGIRVKAGNLDGARMLAAELSLSDLAGSTLTNTQMTYADLTEAVLDGARLDSADLTSAILVRAKMNGASFRRAVLINADLREASQVNGDFEEADLRSADLSGADLRGADHLDSADLVGAKCDKYTKFPSKSQWQCLPAAKERWVVAARPLR